MGLIFNIFNNWFNVCLKEKCKNILLLEAKYDYLGLDEFTLYCMTLYLCKC